MNISVEAATHSSGGMGLLSTFFMLIVVGCVIFLLYKMLTGSDEGKDNIFIDFLKFKKMLSEIILKIAYSLSAIFITFYSFSIITDLDTITMGLVLLIMGNVLLRVIYEFSLVVLMMFRNSTEINNKLSKLLIIEKEKMKQISREKSENQEDKPNISNEEK